ncbi:MAG: hypothetical protein KHX35_07710 [Sutterella wadsworthensis]|nr:hypothetical protein [Sutterella wadsworthensis]
MIIRIDENETETVVYRARIYCWVLMWVLFHVSKIFELTGIPFIYRKLTHRNRLTLMQWLVRFQCIWCAREIYPAGTKIRISKPKISYGYIRWLHNHRRSSIF